MDPLNPPGPGTGVCGAGSGTGVGGPRSRSAPRGRAQTRGSRLLMCHNRRILATQGGSCGAAQRYPAFCPAPLQVPVRAQRG